MASWGNASPFVSGLVHNAGGRRNSLRQWRVIIVCVVLVLVLAVSPARGRVLTPPYFNLAQGRNITATATCGQDVPGPELYCRLTGATGSEEQASREVIRGQLCDYCNPNNPDQDHRPEYAVDGTERFWMSPPLSRGVEYNKINFTIHLGQEFHVAYVFIRMANSPRPGVWALERSIDFGQTWEPWQFFADTPSDCFKFFEASANEQLYYDDQVLCVTEFSKVVPLEGGEIIVSLLNGRPSSNNFSHADILQRWTKATDIRLRLLRTKTLLGHLMAVARQDPTVTRRYYYTIKDISIGGRCVCNGHANSCDRPAEMEGNRLICACEHNTCGEQCEMCCPGFVQKRWQRAQFDKPFMCEPCQCFGHTSQCVFDDSVEKKHLSIDIHGNYEGGGVCQNCQHNTMGINCEKCIPTFYRPYGVERSDPDACRPCECDLKVSTGECEEGSGRCLCRPEFAGINCDRCNDGYYGYPDCRPCDCHINGTEDGICTVVSGSCPCKVNYDGRTCAMCALGYYNFPECRSCDCNPIGASGQTCDLDNGQCRCLSSYGSRDCSDCADGYYSYPTCSFCNCDPAGSEEGICHKQNGRCLCKEHFSGERCDRCEPGFYGFPNCRACQCQQPGSRSEVCADSGQCVCKPNFAGRNCEHCASGHYRYPDCVPCECDLYGSLSRSCDQKTGQCSCRSNFEGQMCGKCKENFYNYPICEVCNCNPAGSKQIPGYPLGGCGIITRGLLCECKDKVEGRICDQCRPGYWSLDRNNLEGCEDCRCFKAGTLTGSNVCNSKTGQCMCKPDVTGRVCDTCRDGYFNLLENNPFGCTDCMCNMGGSLSPVCNKVTGQCSCRPRVTGTKCNQPIRSHFYPNLHQLQFELEEGLTPEGHRVRYGYDINVFPEYSWRGYAILTGVQPEVEMTVDIRQPSLYRIIYRYINRNENLVRGDITLTPESTTDVTQKGTVVLLPTLDPKFAVVTSDAVSAFVLNPGRWTISTKVPDIAFLDYFVLIPQDFYEAAVLQQRVASPCEVPNDNGPCLHYKYPDLLGYPFVPGTDGYVVEDGERKKVELYPNQSVTNNLDSTGLAHLNPKQFSFKLDLIIPDPGLYVLVVNYFNPLNISQHVDVEVASMTGRVNSKVNLHSCKFSTPCRQVFMTEDNKVAVYNITTGYVFLTFTGGEDTDVGIDSVTAIPISDWSTEYIRPRIICIRLNGICIMSTYSLPVGTVRIDFELPPNEHRRSTDLPPNIQDPNTGLVHLNSTEPDITLRSTISKPGRYIILFHYYMPTEIGLNVPVTIYVDGQPIQGLFKPAYCPSVSGCRGTITVDTSNIISLNGMDIGILVNNTSGRDVWLDYALIVPAETFSPLDLELQPIDTSTTFLAECVDEGFVLKSNSPFCRDSVFTLTTEFNKGAIQCNCNPDGSLNFNCQSFGGQCQCRDNVIGRTCTACRPGFFGFPDCKPCNCPFGVCHQVTGQCICPPLVEGERCDRCKAEAYGYDILIGCQHCNCNPRGVPDGDLNCQQITGKCSCLPNVGGRKCDTCQPGYHSFPYCQPCDCDPNGTLSEICDQRSSRCLCKTNVQGSRCDECPDGSFHLSSVNPVGCTRCFCFGTTSRCTSSSLRWDQVTSMDGWGITNVLDRSVYEAGNTIAVKARDAIADTNEAIYWVAPPEYLGNKISSYGGKLIFTVLFTLRENTEGIIKPDIILKGSSMVAVHYSSEQPQNSVPLTMTVSLFEAGNVMGQVKYLTTCPIGQYNFRHASSGAAVSREQLMMILFNLQALHIRASYYHLVDEIRLSDVSLDHADENGAGGVASTVEQCECSSSYQGLSCQECAPGHYRSRTSPYLGVCVPCNCNGHSSECDLNTGECFNCQGNTTGTYCEQCLPGYFDNPATGNCHICSCPLPLPSNNFATQCRLSEDGYDTYCRCIPGYTGLTCESCAPGYYGNPREVGSYCQPCRCSSNINVNDPYACDRFSGQCKLCLNNTAGDSCAECKDWFWGDAVIRKDCAACSCSQCGSQSCDQMSGSCFCKPNVIGIDCDKCSPNHWGFDYCDGCRDCNCSTGAVSPQCDMRTGQCACQPGVKGVHCDKCVANHWNLSPSGCQACDCLSDGAVGCDDRTGQCLCLPGVTGTQCDRCLDRWVLVPGQGCQECDYCIHLLLDDLDLLNRNVTIVRRQLADVSIGVAAFNRLAQYNTTLTELKPQVINLKTLNRNEMQERVDPLKREMLNLQGETRATSAKADQTKAQADKLTEAMAGLQSTATETELLIQTQAIRAESAVQFVKQILQQMMDSIKITNIENYISDADRIFQNIQGRNFTLEENSARLELDVLGSLNQLGSRLEQLMNSSMETEKVIKDLAHRLENLGTHSEDSSALMALNELRRLRAQNVEAIERLEGSTNKLKLELENLLSTGHQLIDDAQAALDNATNNFDDLAVDSSKMQVALTELTQPVGGLRDKVGDMDPLVNQSFFHAIALQRQAAELDNMYNNTRDLSSNAVAAGQAYEKIVKYINSAHNTSVRAASNAQTALDVSNGDGEDAAKTQEMSQNLLDVADNLLLNNQSELLASLNTGKAQADMLEKENSAVEKDLGMVQQELNKLNDALAADRSMTVTNKVDVTMSSVSKAAEVLNRILQLLPEDERKLEQLAPSRLTASVDLTNTEGNMESTRQTHSEVKELLQPLQANATFLLGVGKHLDASVASLREKIELAREQANRIRVGLKFLGNTTVAARSPPQLDQAGSYSQLSLFFKTTRPDALLAYIGSPQRERHDPDYMSLELRGGHVVFGFNLGTGSAVIRSNRLFADGQWHEAVAQRIGKSGTLTVRTDKQSDDIVTGSSQSTFVVLELNPATTGFYLGGVPTDFNLPSAVTREHLLGSIEDVKFDDTPIGIWNFADGENNYVGEYARDVMKEVVTNGLRFNGMGYAVLSRSKLSLKQMRTEIQLQFKTYSEFGLLVYMSDFKKDFLAVELKDGHVLFHYDLGSGAVKIESNETYSNGQWHTVMVSREKQRGLLRINSKMVAEALSPGTMADLSTTDNIFIGGIDSVVDNVGSLGYDGCIQNVQFGTVSWDLNDNERAKGAVRGCPEKVARIATFVAERENSYLAVDLASGVGTKFDMTFKMRTKQSEGLMVYIADDPQMNALSIGVVNGSILLRVKMEDGMVELLSRINTYNDSNWHYISIMKDGLQYEMNIDDSEILGTEATAGTAALDTSTPIFLGGVRPGYTISQAAAATTKRFIGCIGDITVQKIIFVNLATIPESQRLGVHLVECPLKSAKETTEIVTTLPPYAGPAATEEEEIVTQAPDQCSLPLVPAAPSSVVVEEGNLFGIQPHARFEFSARTSQIKLRSHFSVSFKTTGKNGLLFYAADQRHVDFIGLYMLDGELMYGFNCGSGKAIISSGKKFNDGKWHLAEFVRNQKSGSLMVDGELLGRGQSQGQTLSMNVNATYFLGGLPPGAKALAIGNVGEGWVSFPGCLRDLKLKDIMFEQPSGRFDVQQCSSAFESGSFFPIGGGILQLFDNFKVGRDLEIQIDIRPRTQNGVLLAVHGAMDYVVLQIVDGSVVFITDNGVGAISTSFPLPANNSLCDGSWHSIRANKNKTVVSLWVDGVEAATQGVGSTSALAADTNHPLYVGGVPDTSAKGVQTTDKFVGCIRNLFLNDKAQQLFGGQKIGDVQVNYCPAT